MTFRHLPSNIRQPMEEKANKIMTRKNLMKKDIFGNHWLVDYKNVDEEKYEDVNSTQFAKFTLISIGEALDENDDALFLELYQTLYPNRKVIDYDYFTSRETTGKYGNFAIKKTKNGMNIYQIYDDYDKL